MVDAVLAVNRVHAFGSADEQMSAELSTLIDVFATLPGFRSARAGRCIDQPDVWILSTEWENVGTYRRALSSYAVKTGGHPVFVRIEDQPGAYEVLISTG